MVTLGRRIPSIDVDNGIIQITEQYPNWVGNAAKVNLIMEQGANFIVRFQWFSADGLPIWVNGKNMISGYTWSLSANSLNVNAKEYYLNNSSSNIIPTLEPAYIVIEGGLGVAGTAGGLFSGQWDWADNDTLGYNTIYVRLSDDTAPSGTEVAMTSFALAMKARETASSSAVVDLSSPASSGISLEDDGKFLLGVTSTDTASTTAGNYLYDIEAVDSDNLLVATAGTPTLRLVDGKLTIDAEMTKA